MNDVVIASAVRTPIGKFQGSLAGFTAPQLGSHAIKVSSFLVKGGAIFGLFTVMIVMLLGQSRVFYSMSRDGLLWQWAGAIHPKWRTPYISTIAVGAFVAFLPALFPIGQLSHLVSIGTLLAFVIVCAGVWIMRVRHPEIHRPFRTPAVPLVPILGIVVCLYLMASLPIETWLRLLVWLALGMAIYFFYGIKHSRVQAGSPAPSPVPPTGDTYTERK